MSHSVKAIILIVLFAINYLLVSSTPVQRVDWSSFFPQSQSENLDENWFDASSQYLLIELPQPDVADEWLENSKILNYYELDLETNLYLLIFERSQQTQLLDEITPYTYSGTSIVGLEIMKNFTQEANYYALYIVPFMLFILFALTSLKYWLNMLIEISSFHLALVFVVFLTGFSVNSASLLALMFLMIYAFTLFNYLHSGEISRSNLAFGISVSVFTTALSSLFLYYSKFGLISSFGAMMLLGLLILFIYSILRLYLIQNFHFPFCFTDREYVKRSTMTKLSLGLFTFLLTLAFLNTHQLSIDLNPVNMIDENSQTMLEIKTFEKKHLDSLPLVIQVSSKDGDFTNFERAQELDTLIHNLEKVLNIDTLYDVSTAYKMFSEEKFKSSSQESYAQFLLALEMMSSGMPIFSSDYKSSFITMMIPLQSDSSDIATMVSNIENMQNQCEDFDVTVMGKIADLGTFSTVFLEEFAIGLGFSLGFIFIFFLFYCKTYRTIVVVISTLFSLLILLSVHAIFSIDVTIMTLLSVILFAGLVTDSIVHIFICYKENGSECFESVTKPIVLSNVSMLVGLTGMLFSGSLMQRFGLELSILIAANLAFIIYIMPYLLNIKIFKKYSSVDDSCGT